MSNAMGRCPGGSGTGAHAFQVTNASLYIGRGPQVRDESVMFCSQCGDSYALDKDGTWHKLDMGNTWTQRAAVSSGQP